MTINKKTSAGTEALKTTNFQIDNSRYCSNCYYFDDALYSCGRVTTYTYFIMPHHSCENWEVLVTSDRPTARKTQQEHPNDQARTALVASYTDEDVAGRSDTPNGTPLPQLSISGGGEQ